MTGAWEQLQYLDTIAFICDMLWEKGPLRAQDQFLTKYMTWEIIVSAT